MKKLPRASVPSDDRMKVRFDRAPRSTRHTVAAVLAVAAALGGYVGPTFSFAAITVMMIVLLFRDELTLDLEHRIYGTKNGFVKRSGSFAHFKGIEVERRQEYTSNGLPLGSLYAVSLIWVNGREQPWVIQQASGMVEALEIATNMSQRLGLPLSEGEGLTQFRNEIEEARKTLIKP